MRIDDKGRLLVGATSGSTETYIQSSRSSGINYVLVSSNTLVSGQTCAFKATAQGRQTEVGVFTNGYLTTAASFLRFDLDTGTTDYYWSDSSGNFRTSTDRNAIGTGTGTVIGAQTSDKRLKNILGPVEYGLDTLKQIEPVRYALKTEPDIEKLGFIAQQVLPLVPQSVFDTGEVIEEGEPTKLGMEYVALIPILVNAIKELSAEVDALKAQLQAP